MTQQNWKTRFDKEFPRFKNRAFTEDTVDAIKVFFDQELKTAREEVKGEIVERIEEEIKQNTRGFPFPTIQESAIRDLLEKIKEL